MGRPHPPNFPTKSSRGIKDFIASSALQPHALIQMQLSDLCFYTEYMKAFANTTVNAFLCNKEKA